MAMKFDPPSTLNELHEEIVLLESKVLPTVQEFFGFPMDLTNDLELEEIERELNSAKDQHAVSKEGWVERAVNWALLQSAAKLCEELQQNCERHSKAAEGTWVHVPLPLADNDASLLDKTEDQLVQSVGIAKDAILSKAADVNTSVSELCLLKDSLKQKIEEASNKAVAIATPKKTIFSQGLASNSAVKRAAAKSGTQCWHDEKSEEESVQSLQKTLEKQEATFEMLQQSKAKRRKELEALRAEVYELQREVDPLSLKNPDAEEISSLDPRIIKEIQERCDDEDMKLLSKVMREEAATRQQDQLHLRHFTILGNVEQLGRVKAIDVCHGKGADLEIALELLDKYGLSLYLHQETKKINGAQLCESTPDVGLDSILETASHIPFPEDRCFVVREVMERLLFLENRETELSRLTQMYKLHFGPEQDDITVMLTPTISVVLTLPSTPCKRPKVKALSGVRPGEEQRQKQQYEKLNLGFKSDKLHEIVQELVQTLGHLA